MMNWDEIERKGMAAAAAVGDAVDDDDDDTGQT